MLFDEMNDEQFELALGQAMRARPLPAAPANLAGRAVALARRTPAANELSRSFRWSAIAAIASAGLVLLVLGFGWAYLQSAQPNANLATLTNLNSLWSSDSSPASDSSTATDTISTTDSASTSTTSEGTLSSLLESSGTDGWLLLCGAVTIGAVVLVLTARALAADDSPLAPGDSMFA